MTTTTASRMPTPWSVTMSAVAATPASRLERTDLGHLVGQQSAVLIGHRDVLADLEQVLAQPMHRFIVGVPGGVIVEEPGLAATLQDPEHRILVGGEPPHRTVGAMGLEGG